MILVIKSIHLINLDIANYWNRLLDCSKFCESCFKVGQPFASSGDSVFTTLGY